MNFNCWKFWIFIEENQVSFFDALRDCPNLKHLDFSFCELSKLSVQSLATSIECDKFPNLEKFLAQANPEIGKSLALFDALKKHRRLQYLNISSCDLSVPSFRILTSPIDNHFLSLEGIDLSRNTVIGVQFRLLLGLKKCRQLKMLNINDCSLSVRDKSVIRKKLFNVNIL